MARRAAHRQTSSSSPEEQFMARQEAAHGQANSSWRDEQLMARRAAHGHAISSWPCKQLMAMQAAHGQATSSSWPGDEQLMARRRAAHGQATSSSCPGEQLITILRPGPGAWTFARSRQGVIHYKTTPPRDFVLIGATCAAGRLRDDIDGPPVGPACPPCSPPYLGTGG